MEPHQPMDMLANAQRLWRLLRLTPSKPPHACTALVIDGHVPGFTPPEAVGLRGVLMWDTLTGEFRSDSELAAHGLKHAVSVPAGHDVVEPTTGQPFESLEALMSRLDAVRDELIRTGWLDTSLDPLNDPD